MSSQALKLANKAASALVKLTINNRQVVVPLGSTLLDAIHAGGFHIPTLCYHPQYKARAVCRMCLVETSISKKPVPACYSKVKEGMKVTTDFSALNCFRRADFQSLLSRHPNECMRCEASRKCKLQDLVQKLQVQEAWPKLQRGSPAHREHKLYYHTSASIHRDIGKCIGCGLCVDGCADQNTNALGFSERGSSKSDDPKILEKRIKGINQIDDDKDTCESRENKEARQVYDTFLEHPLSEKSEELLHTVHSVRGSEREILARFLDAVDHRDAETATSLFDEDGVWNTNTGIFGELHGRDEIRSFIELMLPPKSCRPGQSMPCHKLLSPVEGTDVIMPGGQQVHFDVDLDDDKKHIKTLSRVPKASDLSF